MKNWIAILLLIPILGNTQTSFFDNQYSNDNDTARRLIGTSQPLVQKHNLFLELAGSGGFGSLNFEWMFVKRNKFRWMLRAGISATYIDANNGMVLVFPTMIHGVYSPKTHVHSLDFGIGQSFSITTKGSFFVRTPISIGYRLEPNKKRLFYRFSYTPIISNIVGFQWEHWGGISIGYKLRAR